jgi:hypothetical protein
MDRLEELRQEAIENPLKKKKGCTSCKKKKEVLVSEPPPLPHEMVGEDLWIPTKEEMNLAYDELGSITFTQEKKEFINKVYNFIFNEDFDFNCRSCANTQARKFKNYLGK